MVNFPSAHDTRTPQRRVVSNPLWPSPSAFVSASPSQRAIPQTPRSGRKSRSTSARASPYKIPDRAKMSPSLTPAHGSPMALFTPKEFMADMEARRRQGSGSMGPPGVMDTPTRVRRPTRFPPNLQGRKSSSSLVPLPMIGTPRQVKRPQDPTRPKVKLIWALSKCLVDDNEKDVQWSLRNKGLNERCEDRDRSAKWSTLSRAVHNVWPHVRDWIMRYKPADHDIDWFNGRGDFGFGDDFYIEDPDIATKHSSLERVGFYLSPRSYDAACELIQALRRRRNDLERLMEGGINPFFMIYAFADCDIPLPDNFSRQLIWKHLDAIIGAQCWRGLGSKIAFAQPGPSSAGAHVPPKFTQKEEDPEGIVQRLRVLLQLGSLPAREPDPVPVHQLRISMTEYKWVTKVPSVGTVAYQAGDLDDSDVPSFAVIDALTRVLSHYRGGILEIVTNDVGLLWGVYREPAGAWLVVRAVCESYQVRLRAKWADLKGLYDRDPEDPIPPRDHAVVDAVVGKLGVMKDNAAYKCMAHHLTTFK